MDCHLVIKADKNGDSVFQACSEKTNAVFRLFGAYSHDFPARRFDYRVCVKADSVFFGDFGFHGELSLTLFGAVVKQVMITCSIEGCGKRIVAKGFCDRHYRRDRQGLCMIAPIIKFGLSLKDRVVKGMGEKNLKTGCIHWTMYRNPDGYGQFGFMGKKVFAHRSSFEVFNGEIPKDGIVRHCCDNPSCVNPEHLVVGDSWDNVQDCLSRGRFQMGWKHWNTRFTDSDIMMIRELYGTKEMNLKQIGERFGVSFQTISRIVRRDLWKHIA